MENCGIVYAATGAKRNFDEAIFSASSAINLNKEVKITMFTDGVFEKAANDSNLFERVVKLNKPNSRSKLDAILGSPYEKSLYIDNDTEFRKNVLGGMFKLLDRFDIALSHAPLLRVATPLKDIPDCFPEFNGGLILFKKNKKVIDVMERWKEDYHKKNIKTRYGHRDQPYLRRALWESDLRIATLLPEYNVRSGRPGKKACIAHRHGLNKKK